MARAAFQRFRALVALCFDYPIGRRRAGPRGGVSRQSLRDLLIIRNTAWGGGRVASIKCQSASPPGGVAYMLGDRRLRSVVSRIRFGGAGPHIPAPGARKAVQLLVQQGCASGHQRAQEEGPGRLFVALQLLGVASSASSNSEVPPTSAACLRPLAARNSRSYGAVCRCQTW